MVASFGVARYALIAYFVTDADLQIGATHVRWLQVVAVTS